MEATKTQPSPPYPPQAQSLGSLPSAQIDVPVSAVFITLWTVGALVHGGIFAANRKSAHKFLFSITLFALSVIRPCSAALRVAWARHVQDVRVAIAAQAMTSVGTVVLYIVNFFLAQRLMRARHPRIGWNAPYAIFMPGIATAVTLVFFVTLIVSSLLPSFTLDPRTLQTEHNLLVASLAWMLVASILPMVSLGAMLLIPHAGELDRFGSGSFRTKAWILLTACLLLTFSAAWRLGAVLSPSTPLRSPTPWYLSETAFYIVNQGLELLLVLGFALVRVDRRFWVPDGACHEGAYSVEVLLEMPRDDDQATITLRPYDRAVVDDEGHAVAMRDGRRLSHFERQLVAIKPQRESSDTGLSPSASAVLEYNVQTGQFGLKDQSFDDRSVDPVRSGGDQTNAD